MKYIIALLIVTSSLFSQEVKIESIEETRLEITYPSDYKNDKNHVFVFAYIQPNVKFDIQSHIPLEGIVPIQEEVNLRKLKPINDKIYILGKNTKHDKITLTGLLPKSHFTINSYYLYEGEYRRNMALVASTKAIEPKESPEGIIFKNTDTDHLYITWKEAINSEGSLLLVSKDKPPIPPVDGAVFKPSNIYGTSESVNDGTTYSLFSGQKKFSEFLKIQNLEYGTYYFQVYSYNGNNEFINYNIKPGAGNPRSVTMKLAPPELEDFDYLEETIELEWTKVKGATSYEVQVGLDPEFITTVENYDKVDVGNTTKYEMYTIESVTNYYVRVRAKNGRNISQWSNILELED